MIVPRTDMRPSLHKQITWALNLGGRGSLKFVTYL